MCVCVHFCVCMYNVTILPNFHTSSYFYLLNLSAMVKMVHKVSLLAE